MWGEILQVDAAKQHIFLQRVLFMFDCVKRSAGKAQSLKLSLERWNYECDMACLGGYVLHEMQQHRNEENLHVFPAETIALLMSRFIEG